MRLERIEAMLLSMSNNNAIGPIKAEFADVKDQLSISELAEYLDVSKSTVHRYKNNKVIPFYKAGRTVFFKIKEVEEALSSVPKKKGASNK